MEESQKYPNRLRALRNDRKLSQTEVASLTGFSIAAVNRHENGNRSLDADAIDRYAKLYKVSPYELFVAADEVAPDNVVVMTADELEAAGEPYEMGSIMPDPDSLRPIANAFARLK